MKYSTVLLCISWIPLIHLKLACSENYFYFKSDFILILFSLLLSVVAAWVTIKSINKYTALYKLVIRFTPVMVFLSFNCLISVFFLRLQCEYKPIDDLILYPGYGLLILILTVVGLWFWNHHRRRIGKTIFTTIMYIIAAVVFLAAAYAIPAIFIHLYRCPYAKYRLFYFFLFLFALSFLTALLAVMFQSRRGNNPIKSMIHVILIFFFFISLFGIPFYSIIIPVIKSYRLSYNEVYTGLITGIMSSLMSVAALVLAWKEARKQDKPYIPALKVILASVFILWQINIGFHLYLNSGCLLSIEIMRDWILEWRPFVVFRIILFILFCYVIFWFFMGLFFRKKPDVKLKRHLFFSGTGLLMVLGTYVLIACLEKLARFLRFSIDLNPMVLSFITVIEPILLMAVVFALMGMVFSFFKEKDEQPLYTGRLRRGRISIGISLISIILYLLLFKSFWPLQNPSIHILIGMIRKYWTSVNRDNQAYNANFANIYSDSYKEIVSFGKLAVKPLINALKNKNEDRDLRETSAYLLQHIGDRRALEPLISLLDDPDPVLKKNIIEVLGYIKDPAVVEALIERLGKEKSDYMKGKINLTLNVITDVWCGEKEENMQEWWQQWWNKNKEDFIARHARSKDSR